MDVVPAGPAFCHLLRVRYAECDAQMVVFNVRYGEYVAVAYNEFIRAICTQNPDSERRPPWVPEVQLVKQVVEWRGSARFDDIVAISVTVGSLGTTSFTLIFEFRIHGQEDVFARAETVYVSVKREGSRYHKTPYSAEFRQALQTGAPGQFSDHAGAMQAVHGRS